jgi:hypothetical protein
MSRSNWDFRVDARGVPISHSPRRTRFSAMAINTCCKCVLAIPLRFAVNTREFDLDHLVVSIIYRRRPTQAPLSLRAGRFLFVPINLKTPGVESTASLGLPVTVRTRRSVEIDTILTRDGDEQFGLDITRIYQVPARK